jgi:hypothetical protein
MDEAVRREVVLHSTVPHNQSLQPTWLSRLQLMPVFVCSRFRGWWARRISRHAAELRLLGGTASVGGFEIDGEAL